MKLAERGEAAAVAAGLPAEVNLALADVAGAVRDGLLAFSCSAGMLVIGQIMAEEMAAKVGPKGRHDPDRVAIRNGTAPGSVALGGRSVPVERPRATMTGGGELALDSYALFSATDLLHQLAVERMLAGVATRRHAQVAELEALARGDSRSAISRRFKAATAKALDELLARDLAELDVAALMIDAIIFAEVCCVVARAITADGAKVPVGLWGGDTENATVVPDLARRPRRSWPALRGRAAGGHRRRQSAGQRGKERVRTQAIVQRSPQVRERRLVPARRPRPGDGHQVGPGLQRRRPRPGKRVAEGIARQLEAKYPTVAASLREGLDEMFTVRRLGASDRLACSLSCTNAISRRSRWCAPPPSG